MNPLMGSTACEIGKKLFSFQFRSYQDMKEVLSREQWLFDKNILSLKELGGGEQPSAIYDLPMIVRTKRMVNLIAEKCGTVVEVEHRSLEGLSQSVRVKVNIDLTKPLKRGITLELRTSKSIWAKIKYELLPSFCFFCGIVGHMRRECDLVDGSTDMGSIPDSKLPYGKWKKASPMKQASVKSDEQRRPPKKESLCKKFFEKFKQSIHEGEPDSDAQRSAPTDLAKPGPTGVEELGKTNKKKKI
ncbi:hypothetical protein ACS0TY_006039 [Phlomoides rotata]